MEKMKFLIIGGDMRQIFLAIALKNAGHYVAAVYINCDICEKEGIALYDSVSAAITDCDVVILPLPFAGNVEHLNTPLWDGIVGIKEIFLNLGLHKEKIIVGGMIDKNSRILADKYGLTITDYLEREEFAVLNAIATAEGAISIAIDEMSVNIHSCNAVVLGFGRIGKLLCKDLKALSANVVSAARKKSDLAWIKANNYEAVTYSKLEYKLFDADVIFNTVPQLILNKNLLKLLKKDCLIIDLASKPGGVDFNAAALLGINTVWALSLPGKVSPVSSGKILMDTILNIVDEISVG